MYAAPPRGVQPARLNCAAPPPREYLQSAPVIYAPPPVAPRPQNCLNHRSALYAAPPTRMQSVQPAPLPPAYGAPGPMIQPSKPALAPTERKCHCGTRLTPDSNFCGKCGAEWKERQCQERQCPCGNNLSCDMKFCGHCGKEWKDPQLRMCQCGTALFAESAFCHKCGTQWDDHQRQCRCGVLLAAKANFCASCGANKTDGRQANDNFGVPYPNF